MTVRKTEEALGALHGAWGVTLPTMLAAFNKALADVSAAVRYSMNADLRFRVIHTTAFPNQVMSV